MPNSPRLGNHTQNGNEVRLDEAEPELTDRQARAMAYADGELQGAERRRFEREMAEDPALARAVADHQELLDLTRFTRRLEPTQAEMERFWARLPNRFEWQLGATLFGGGLLFLVGLGVQWLATEDVLEDGVRAGALSTLAGFVLLLRSTWRQRIRSRRVDRFRGVIR